MVCFTKTNEWKCSNHGHLSHNEDTGDPDLRLVSGKPKSLKKCTCGDSSSFVKKTFTSNTGPCSLTNSLMKKHRKDKVICFVALWAFTVGKMLPQLKDVIDQNKQLVSDNKTWKLYLSKFLENCLRKRTNCVKYFGKCLRELVCKAGALVNFTMGVPNSEYRKHLYLELFWKKALELKSPAGGVIIDDNHPKSVCVKNCIGRRNTQFTWLFNLAKEFQQNVTFKELNLAKFRSFTATKHPYCHKKYVLKIVDNNTDHEFCGYYSHFLFHSASNDVKMVGFLEFSPFSINIWFSISSLKEFQNKPIFSKGNPLILWYTWPQVKVEMTAFHIRHVQFHRICVKRKESRESKNAEIDIYDGPSFCSPIFRFWGASCCASGFQIILLQKGTLTEMQSVVLEHTALQHVPHTHTFRVNNASQTKQNVINSSQLCVAQQSLPCVLLVVGPKTKDVGVNILHFKYHGISDYICSFGGLSLFEYFQQFQEIMTLCPKTNRYLTVKNDHPKTILAGSSRMLLVIYDYKWHSDVSVEFNLTQSVCTVVSINPCSLRTIWPIYEDLFIGYYLDRTEHENIFLVGPFHRVFGDGCITIQISTDFEYTLTESNLTSLESLDFLSGLQPRGYVYDCHYPMMTMMDSQDLMAMTYNISATENHIKSYEPGGVHFYLRGRPHKVHHVRVKGNADSRKCTARRLLKGNNCYLTPEVNDILTYHIDMHLSSMTSNYFLEFFSIFHQFSGSLFRITIHAASRAAFHTEKDVIFVHDFQKLKRVKSQTSSIFVLSSNKTGLESMSNDAEISLGAVVAFRTVLLKKRSMHLEWMGNFKLGQTGKVACAFPGRISHVRLKLDSGTEKVAVTVDWVDIKLPQFYVAHSTEDTNLSPFLSYKHKEPIKGANVESECYSMEGSAVVIQPCPFHSFFFAQTDKYFRLHLEKRRLQNYSYFFVRYVAKCPQFNCPKGSVCYTKDCDGRPSLYCYLQRCQDRPFSAQEAGSVCSKLGSQLPQLHSKWQETEILTLLKTLDNLVEAFYLAFEYDRDKVSHLHGDSDST